MAKYIPKEFAPNVFPAWLEIFKTLTQEERSELLLAITAFPSYEPKGVALWPFFRGELERQLAKFRARNGQQSANRSRSTMVNHGQPRSTTVNDGELTKQLVDQSAEHKTITITETGNIEHKTENSEQDIDTHPSPSARTASSSSSSKRLPSIQKPDGVEDEDWQAYIRLRKQKRLPLTQRALDSMLAEAEKVNLTPQQMIVCCLERSWASFRSEWYEKEQSEKPFDFDKWAAAHPELFDDTRDGVKA